MNTEELKEKFKQGVDKIVTSSKKAIGKAGVAMQDFSDKSVIRIEKHQLETKLEAEYIRLGELVAARFLAEPSASVSASEDTVASIIKEISRYNEEIKKREETLAEEHPKTKDAEELGAKENHPPVFHGPPEARSAGSPAVFFSFRKAFPPHGGAFFIGAVFPSAAVLLPVRVAPFHTGAGVNSAQRASC